MNVLRLPKKEYDTTECDGDPLNPTVSWQQYYSFRNQLLSVLRPFGSVGPMGECRITEDADGPPEPWPVETSHPDFFVLDDWLNNCSFWIKIETDNKFVTVSVLQALHDVLKTMPAHWAIGIATGEGYILLFADKIMTDGPQFESCATVKEVLQRCSAGA